MMKLRETFQLILVFLVWIIPGLSSSWSREDPNLVNQILDSNQGFNISRCSNPSGSLDSAVLVETEDGELQDFTTVQIGLGDTVCYRFSPTAASNPATTNHEDLSSNINSGLRGSIEVTFKRIKSVYSIPNSYYFKLAKANVACACDCPGGTNSCNSKTNSCGDSPNCLNYYTTSVTSEGCFFRFLKLSSALCCSIQISPQSPHRFRAIQLSVPTMVAEFEVIHRDSDHNAIDSRIYNIDLNSGTTIDWEVSLQVSSAGPTVALPPTWYVLPPPLMHHSATERSLKHVGGSGLWPEVVPWAGRHSLLGNLPLNGLDEWDIHKLGWFKSRKFRDHIDPTGHQIRQAFGAQVSNCQKNRVFSEFSSSSFLNSDQLSSARLVESMFPFVQSLQVWRRHVEIVHRESPLLTLTMQHRNKVDVVMQYHESSLSDFNGYLLVDTHSNQYLNLTLSKFRGTLHGLVTGLDSTQAIQISTGSPGLTRDESEDEGEAADTVWKEVRVTGILCNKLGQVGVSLHPSGKKAESRVKQLRCLESGLREFRRVEAGYQGDDAGANTFRQNQREEDSDESWGSYLNPVNWAMAAATGGWGVTKSLVLALAVVTWAAVIFCCVKLLCCLNVCSRNK